MATSSLFDLTGKRALVTGSSQGIGFALAEALAGSGATIVLNGRDEGELDSAGLRKKPISVATAPSARTFLALLLA